MKYILFVIVLLSFQINKAQNSSSLYQNWVDAQVNNTTSILPTFSYAGYKNGEISLPNQLIGQVYDVTNYGAIANDNISDKQAIMDAISAAESNPNGGVVFFPSGRFIINDAVTDDVNQIIKITKNNIVLKGSGSGIGGTELYQKDYVPHSNQATKPWINPYLIEFTNGENFTKPKITNVTENADRETYTVQVESTANISAGQWVELFVNSTNTNFLTEELTPFSTSDFYEPQNLNIVNNGVTVRELHKVISKTTNSITFKEPLHRAVNAVYGWEIRRFTPIENVGIQDLKYTGGYIWDFIHHKAPKELYPNEPEATEFAFLSDAAWSGIRLRQVVNGWIRNVVFSNMSRGAEFSSSANCTALDNTYVGNPGHAFISTNNATGCFIGKSIDKSTGVWHGAGVSGASIANVLWRNEHPANGDSGMEIHANQPRSNLFDACKGGFFFNQGGATTSLPNHLKNLVLWNFEGTSYQDSNVKSFRPTSESRFAKFITPIISGLKGFTMSSDANQFQENESEGTHVDEKSLYEKQLMYRLGYLPDWVTSVHNNTIIYSEDFSSTFGKGFTRKVINNGGHPDGSNLLKVVSDIPDESDSNNLFNTDIDREILRIPNGNLRNQKTISISGVKNGVNYAVNAYAVFTTLNLTDTNAKINPEDKYKYATFWTQRRFGDGDIANITLEVSTDYEGIVLDATWVTVPLISGKLSDTSDNRNFVKGVVDLTPFANGANGDKVTLALRYVGSNTTNSSSNRNGTFYISDLQFIAQPDPITDVWTGSLSSNFYEPKNWKSKVVPVNTTNNIYIPNNAANYPSISNSITANRITFEAGASFITDATVNADVVYKRLLATPETTGNSSLDSLEGWHLVAAPVSGETYNVSWANSNGIALGTGSARAIATYDNTVTSNNWNYFNGTGSDTFIIGKGYAIKRTSTGIVSFSGTMNTSDIDNVAITPGFNLIGNPFTAFVDSKSFLELTNNDNLLDSRTIWIWNAETKNYEAKLAGDPIPFKIAPGQGFFVKTTSSGNVDFNLNMLSHQTNDTFLKTSNTQSPEISLKVFSDRLERFTKVRYIDSATTSFDNGFDAETFTGSVNDLDVFSYLIDNSNGKKYQVQSIPNSNYQNMVIPVGISSKTQRDITFSIAAENLPTGYNVYLEDRVDNTVTQLNTQNASYNVNINTGETLGRFYLHLSTSSVLSTTSNVFSDVRVFQPNHNTLRVLGIQAMQAKIELYNILGHWVLRKKFIGAMDNTIELPKLSSGLYILKLTTKEGEMNQKIILE